MKYEELKERVAATLREPSGIAYYLSYSKPGEQVAPTAIAIAEQSDGSYLVCEGDLRQKTSIALDSSGKPLVFPDEDSACDWAWGRLRDAGSTPPPRSPQQQAQAEASGDEQRRRAQELLGL